MDAKATAEKIEREKMEDDGYAAGFAEGFASLNAPDVRVVESRKIGRVDGRKDARTSLASELRTRHARKGSEATVTH